MMNMATAVQLRPSRKETDNLWVVVNLGAPYSLWKLLSVLQREKEEAKINLEPIPKCHPAVAESLNVVKDHMDLKWIKFSM